MRTRPRPKNLLDLGRGLGTLVARWSATSSSPRTSCSSSWSRCSCSAPSGCPRWVGRSAPGSATSGRRSAARRQILRSISSPSRSRPRRPSHTRTPIPALTTLRGPRTRSDRSRTTSRSRPQPPSRPPRSSPTASRRPKSSATTSPGRRWSPNLRRRQAQRRATRTPHLSPTWTLCTANHRRTRQRPPRPATRLSRTPATAADRDPTGRGGPRVTEHSDRDDRRAAAVALARVVGLDAPDLADRLQDHDPRATLAERLGAHTSLLPEDPEPLISRARAQIAEWERRGFRLLTVLQDDYPGALQMVHDRPALLWVAGDPAHLQDEKAIAVVGSRQPGEDGEAQAASYATDLVEAGFTVVSGLAAVYCSGDH